ncbi:nucleoside monophosphate kinase [Candidatus Saccharibacteria bacterium]|nr:nucleoside monophosphate kinase [Candidatus Saccharibacteria bacterium]
MKKHPPINLTLFGAPFAGKTTQATKICERYGSLLMDAGHIIREEITANTPLGQEAGPFIDRKEFIPTHAVIAMLKGRIATHSHTGGFVYAGFPRSIEQVQAADENNIIIDCALHIELSSEAFTTRMEGRRTCENCVAVYHVTDNPPIQPDICDKCSSPLIVRLEDNPASNILRLQDYYEKTAPLINYFAKASRLITVQSQPRVDDTARLIFAALDKKLR